MRTTDNLFLQTDSYKLTQPPQYPRDATRLHSYLESRGGAFEEVVWFGLQGILHSFMGRVLVLGDVDELDNLASEHFGPGTFDRRPFDELVAAHGGRLPLRIRAVPEGTVVPIGNVLMTVENTDPRFPWLANFVETMLLRVWAPTTVATQSREMAKVVLGYLRKNGSPELLPYKVHDFGCRGVSSLETAAICGAAHLVNFRGTDTLPALAWLRDHYSEPCAGHSIFATEHSTVTSHGGPAAELAAFSHMLDAQPSGMLACVSDSYDVYRACRELWGGELRERVLARDGVLVVRPDSGDPLETLPEVLRILGEQFGFTVNAKGYRVLDPHVRVIQGDGVNLISLGVILAKLDRLGWSADNIAFGSGGALLQQVNRDTCKFATKVSAVERAGAWHDVYKDPITDPGKRSKRGRLCLRRHPTTGEYGTFRIDDPDPVYVYGYGDDLLRTVFEDGELLVRDTLAQVRERAALDGSASRT